MTAIEIPGHTIYVKATTPPRRLNGRAVARGFKGFRVRMVFDGRFAAVDLYGPPELMVCPKYAFGVLCRAARAVGERDSYSWLSLESANFFGMEHNEAKAIRRKLLKLFGERITL